MQDNEPVWKALLQFAVDEAVDALLDCGALLAGASNRCYTRGTAGTAWDVLPKAIQPCPRYLCMVLERGQTGPTACQVCW